MQFERKAVYMERVTPSTQSFQQNAAPAGCANILNGRPTRPDDYFKVIDELLGFSLEPRGIRIDAECKVHPLFRCPGWGGIRKWNIDLAIHLPSCAVWLRRRSVMLNDDFGIGIDSLDLSNETKSLSSVAFRIVRVADDKGKFRDDAKLMRPPCHF